MWIYVVELCAIVGAAIVGAFMIMSFLQSRQIGQHQHTHDAKTPADCGTVFLFQDNVLVDATKNAWALINHRSKSLTDYDAVLTAITAEFPSLKATLDDPATSDIRIRSASDPSVYVDVQRQGPKLRIAIGGEEEAYENAAKRLSQASIDAQSSLMKDISANSPQLIWHEDTAGTLLWANDAYTAARAKYDLEAFHAMADAQVDPKGPTVQRVSVKSTDGEDIVWFDITKIARPDGALYFADEATELVQALKTKTEFIQTLGKTFGDLSIGLAVFDKNRRLAVFNPALFEMTKLPIEFLSTEPTIDTFLDRLRELRMMPEPKNYTTWREQFIAVEMAAKDGTYSKNWTLPEGQVYRVKGTPHPDGAFALMFEDISAEMSLTRRFRLDIETGQAVLDTLTDAIAVFSSTGTMVMSNSAYGNLWANNSSSMLEHRVLQSEMKTWQDQCIPSAMWDDMRTFIQQLGARKPWSDHVLLEDGRHLACKANPIAGGMTMVRFVIAPPKRPEFHKITLPDPAIQASKR
ncbi:PAS-domain containing protein [Yoonia sp. F2084L]|uniref:PAS-domain containing protein n=1 Tax=Yoonia sp. F2084L TaxID=2926419 RepID=UPI001FF2689B|nr:PAS-domain containing protein [Yoonia sp. F2084L]MCK0097204.1 PAS-domain containing protein [Yoonia sp. F2084L]